MPFSPIKARELRRAAGLTQKQVADQIGVYDHQVSTWELGKQTPPLGRVERLAVVFGVPITALLDDQVEVPKNGKETDAQLRP